VNQGQRELKLIMHFAVDITCIFYPRAVLIILELVRSGSNVSYNKRKKDTSIFRYNCTRDDVPRVCPTKN
jgi:hypothetical protein